MDKVREVTDGHDGTWVAHPGLVPVAKDMFDKYMPGPNQISRKLDDSEVTAAELLAVPEETISEQGLRQNVDVGIQYMASWLSGNGCVPIYNLMEDAAMAKISRFQIWHWLHNDHTKLDDGWPINSNMVQKTIVDVLLKKKRGVGEEFFASNNYQVAAELFEEISLKD